MNGSAPKAAPPSALASQVRVRRKFQPNSARAGQAPVRRTAMKRATRTGTKRTAAVTTPKKRRSPAFLRGAGRAAPPGSISRGAEEGERVLIQKSLPLPRGMARERELRRESE